MYKITVRHVDTCLSCYVTDHCNGENELLVGVAVNGTTTYQDVKDQVGYEMKYAEKMPRGIRYDDISDAVNDMFENITALTAPFDSSLEVVAEDSDEANEMDEGPQAWFRVTWEVEV